MKRELDDEVTEISKRLALYTTLAVYKLFQEEETDMDFIEWVTSELAVDNSPTPPSKSV